MAGRTFDVILRLVNRVSPNANKIARDMDKMGDSAKALAPLATAAGLAMGAVVSQKILGGFSQATQEFAKTESALRRLETVARGTSSIFGNQLSRALQVSQEFSKEHRQTTVDLLGAMFELGTAGLSVEESMAGATQAAFLANAVMLDLTTSSRLVGTIFNTLGRTTSLSLLDPFQKAERITNALAQSIQLFAVTGPQLAEGLKFAIGSASLLGIELEQLVVALGLLNTAGLKGTVAGTALNQAFIQLDKAIRKLELNPENFLDATGSLTKISALIEEVNRKTGNLAPFERFNKIIKAFGVRGARAVAALLPFNSEMDRLAARIAKNEESAKRLSDIFENSLETNFIKLKNRVSVLGQEIGNNLAPTLTSLAEAFAVLVRGATNLFSALGSSGTIILGASVAIGGLVAALGALSVAFSVATGEAITFGAAVTAVFPAVRAITLIGAAVGALVFSFADSATASEKFNATLKGFNDVNFSSLDDQVRRVSSSLLTVESAAKGAEGSVSALSRAQTTLSVSSKSTVGSFVRQFSEQGLQQGLNPDQISSALQSAINQAFEITDPTSFKNLDSFLTPESFQQSIVPFQGVIDSFKQLKTEVSTFRTSKAYTDFLTSGVKIEDLQKSFGLLIRPDTFKGAVRGISELANVAKKSGDEVFATVFPNIVKDAGLTEERLTAVRERLIDLYNEARRSPTTAEGLPAFRDLQIQEFLKEVDALTNNTSIGKDFENLDSIIGSVAAQIQKFASVSFVQEQVRESESRVLSLAKTYGDLIEAIEKGEASQAEFLQGTSALVKINNQSRETIKNLEKTQRIYESLLDDAKARGDDNSIEVLEERIDSVIEAVRKQTQGLAESVDLEKIYRDAIGKGFQVVGPNIKSSLESAIKAGLVGGVESARTSFAESLGKLVNDSVIAGFTKTAAIGGLEQFLDSIKIPISQFIGGDAGAQQDALAQIRGAFIGSPVGVTDVASGLSDIKELTTFLNQLIFPEEIFPQDSLNKTITSLNTVKNSLVDIRAAILTESDIRGRSLLAEAESIISNSSRAGRATQQSQIVDLLGRIQSTGAGGQAVPALTEALKRLLSGDLPVVNEIKSLPATFETSAVKAKSVATAFSEALPSVTGMKDAFDDAVESAQNLAPALVTASTEVRAIVDKILELNQNLTVSSSSSDEKIEINLGGFNVSIDATGNEDVDEIVDQVETELRRGFENDLLELKRQLREVQNQSGR